jgi:DNA modification methylase
MDTIPIVSRFLTLVPLCRKISGYEPVFFAVTGPGKCYMSDHKEDARSKATQDIDELAGIEKESQAQKLPEQKVVFKTESIKSRAGRRGVHNLPDPTNPPMGLDPEKAFDSVFPFLKLPYLQPNTTEDIISFGSSDAGGFLDAKNKKIPLNAVFFGDNLHILRALPSNCIDLIYIDPPFFSGRNYNQIWGDDNEVRTFHDIWEDGLPSYLVWLNARLWEMRRVLKTTGSIYVHCDWHASHYIKCELDKIFGYENFRSNLVWCYKTREFSKKYWNRKHDDVLFYTKTDDYAFRWDEEEVLEPYSEVTVKKYKHKDEKGVYRLVGRGITGSPIRSAKDVAPEWEKTHPELVTRNYLKSGYAPNDYIIMDIINQASKERMGYPTQKPEALLRKVIRASSKEGDVVADFFMGGGTTCAVAQKLNRRFIGCDISRVAASVTLNRLIKDAEDISGRTASVNIDKPKKKNEQLGLEMTIKPIPDIRVYYTGVYPIEKFEFIEQKQFEDFILTCYGASRFTGEGKITGVMNAGTSLLIGSVKPNESLSEADLKKFVEDTLRLRYQENLRLRLKVVAWLFPPGLQKYAQVIENYFYKKNVPVEIELIPINSQLFRKRILDHYPDASKSEFLLKFISQASIMDIACKKVEGLKYQFEAIGARSNNLDGYLINCQWDFNFAEGRFADSEYALMREQKDGRYVAVLKAEKEFDSPGKYIVACRVQDNLGGEAIKTKEFQID